MNTDLNYDPKLRTAMAEIKNILARFDIGAAVVLQSETHTEFEMHLEPSWSLIRFVRDGDALHIKLHFSKKEQLTQTVGMIYSFRDVCALIFRHCDQIAKQIEEHADVTHTVFGPNGITTKEDDKGPA